MLLVGVLTLFQARRFYREVMARWLGWAILRVAGVKLIVTNVLISGMNMPPTPSERRNGTGSTVSESKPIPTATPEKTTE